MKRSLILSVLGHVDHGKSSLLDKIRNSAITATEAGGITQAIGASIIPISTIKKICGKLLDSLKTDITLPGFLTIDTPGHAAFTNLRKRGGNLADIAILVVDINEGLMPQTLESINILRDYKTPFVIAANKVDLIHGWQNKDQILAKSIEKQSPEVIAKFETKMYEMVGQLQENGLDAERFDRVEDFTKKITIIPVSAKTGEGIPELLMIITALAQKYLNACLECNTENAGKGTILEVKEDKGLGTTIDVILYEGNLKVNDMIVIGGIDKPIVTKVRALLQPTPLAEMRDKKSKYDNVKEVYAATGVKISAPDMNGVIAGMPIRVATKLTLEKVSEEIQKEVNEVLIETDKEGVVIKADTLGALEALSKLLKDKKIPIRKAAIGNITKKDVVEAESNLEKNPLHAVILGFNVKAELDSCSYIKIIMNQVVYRLIEEYDAWVLDMEKNKEKRELDLIIRPCKVQLMTGYVFRQNNPAVCGTDIIAGVLKTGTPLMNKEGMTITTAKEMQENKENICEAKQGKQVAVSYDKITMGRQAMEGDFLYSAMPEEDFRKLKKLKKYLTAKEVECIKEIMEIMRVRTPLWGI
ncbi:MAG: translation initiation factor IF-2 [Candidatus Woesearchaeota archaeon]